MIQQAHIDIDEWKVIALDVSNLAGIFRTDAQGHCLYVNNRWCEITGLPAEEAAGMGWISAIHPADQEQVWAGWEKARQENRPFWGEYRWQRPDGMECWVCNQTEIERDSNGQIVGHIGTLIDVSERRRTRSLRDMQNSILEQIAKGELLPDILNNLVLAIESHLDGTLCSIQFCDVTGRLRHGIAPNLPVSYARVIDGLMIGEGMGSSGTAAFRGTPVIVPDITTDPLWSDFIEIALSHGLRSCWSVPIIASNGNILGTFDVYSANVRTASSPDLDTLTRAANIACIALERVRATQALKQLNQELEAKVTERTIALSKSQKYLLEANEKLSLTNNELLRATRLKDEFLANMSHELRTPLNAILGISEGLQEEVYGILNERQKKSLATIERSGRHLLALINDILEVSKIEAGKLELEFTTIDIMQLCQSSLSFIKQQAVQKGLHLQTRFSANLGTMMGDERRLRQVLINLLNNAVKFTAADGHVKLDVYLEAVTHEPRSVNSTEPHYNLCLAISDTGIGIAPADLDKLFQPFVQIDSSLNRKHEGTGLGLTLVKQIVELHGGNVQVTSTEGQGSCFIVCLPYPDQSVQSVLLPEEPESISSLVLNPNHKLVLVVEDSSTAFEQTARYLGEVGLDAANHAQGEGAVEAALRLQPMLIILDILLIHQSGWETLKQLKRHPKTCDIPVVVVSVIDERSRSLRLGAVDCLVKPFSRSQLRAVIEKISYPSLSQTLPDEMLQQKPEPALILLAEDNLSNIETFTAYLEGRGYRLITAQDGQAAITAAATYQPDLILMDIQMPGMDGLEAMRHIRAYPQLQTTPIIALTALAMPGDREACLAAGASQYLSKPIRLKELATAIADSLTPVFSADQN